jgi:hypothetical protein
MMPAIDRNVTIVGRQRTSQAAAEKFHGKSGGWRQQLYWYLQDCGFDGATDQQMQEHFGKSGDTIRPTRVSLVRDKLVIDSGRTRANDSGNQCIIWMVAEFEGRLM